MAEAGGAAPALDRSMVALLIALFANAVAMASPFPFAPFLVLHYGLTDDRAEIGYYGGFILSAFMLGRAMSSYHLGLLSDKHGRVLVIEIGLLSCIIFQLLFGLAPTFGAALAARLLMGLFNGIIGVAKAMLPELVTAAQQPRAMSAISGMWGLGNVAGPALGGLLYGVPLFAGVDAPALLPTSLGAGLALAAR